MSWDISQVEYELYGLDTHSGARGTVMRHATVDCRSTSSGIFIDLHTDLLPNLPAGYDAYVYLRPGKPETANAVQALTAAGLMTDEIAEAVARL
ncbi:hypothetical protein [Deinococcus kurensis]|uniref:hypothetical protein n=1 Tax=Deinococcus kurensis TaxID=2662757 RepID=UPI0012D2D7F9|nr:hypothetical protein [Deinococcus kurensis]